MSNLDEFTLTRKFELNAVPTSKSLFSWLFILDLHFRDPTLINPFRNPRTFLKMQSNCFVFIVTSLKSIKQFFHFSLSQLSTLMSVLSPANNISVSLLYKSGFLNLITSIFMSSQNNSHPQTKKNTQKPNTIRKYISNTKEQNLYINK
jgi:hypothetical protein